MSPRNVSILDDQVFKVAPIDRRVGLAELLSGLLDGSIHNLLDGTMAEQTNFLYAMSIHLVVLCILEEKELKTAKEISMAWRRHLGPHSDMLCAPLEHAAFLQMPTSGKAAVVAVAAAGEPDKAEEDVEDGDVDPEATTANAPADVVNLVRIPLETLGVGIASRNHVVKGTPMLDIAEPGTAAIVAMHLAMASRRMFLAQNAADSRSNQPMVAPVWAYASNQFQYFFEIIRNPSYLRGQDWWKSSFGAPDGGVSHETMEMSDAQRHAPWTIPFTRELAKKGIPARELRWPCWDTSRPRRVEIALDGAVTFGAIAATKGLVRGLDVSGRLTGDLTQPFAWSKLRNWHDSTVGKAKMRASKAAELLYGTIIRGKKEANGEARMEVRVWPSPCVTMAIEDALGNTNNSWYAEDWPSHFYLFGVQQENGKVHCTPELLVPAFRRADLPPDGGATDEQIRDAALDAVATVSREFAETLALASRKALEPAVKKLVFTDAVAEVGKKGIPKMETAAFGPMVRRTLDVMEERMAPLIGEAMTVEPITPGDLAGWKGRTILVWRDTCLKTAEAVLGDACSELIRVRGFESYASVANAWTEFFKGRLDIMGGSGSPAEKRSRVVAEVMGKLMRPEAMSALNDAHVIAVSLRRSLSDRVTGGQVLVMPAKHEIRRAAENYGLSTEALPVAFWTAAVNADIAPDGPDDPTFDSRFWLAVMRGITFLTHFRREGMDGFGSTLAKTGYTSRDLSNICSNDLATLTDNISSVVQRVTQKSQWLDWAPIIALGRAILAHDFELARKVCDAVALDYALEESGYYKRAPSAAKAAKASADNVDSVPEGRSKGSSAIPAGKPADSGHSPRARKNRPPGYDDIRQPALFD